MRRFTPRRQPGLSPRGALGALSPATLPGSPALSLERLLRSAALSAERAAPCPPRDHVACLGAATPGRLEPAGPRRLVFLGQVGKRQGAAAPVTAVPSSQPRHLPVAARTSDKLEPEPEVLEFDCPAGQGPLALPGHAATELYAHSSTPQQHGLARGGPRPNDKLEAVLRMHVYRVRASVEQQAARLQDVGGRAAAMAATALSPRALPPASPRLVSPPASLSPLSPRRTRQLAEAKVNMKAVATCSAGAAAYVSPGRGRVNFIDFRDARKSLTAIISTSSRDSEEGSQQSAAVVTIQAARRGQQGRREAAEQAAAAAAATAKAARQRTLLPASPDSSQCSSTCSSVPHVFGALTSGVNFAFCVQASMR